MTSKISLAIKKINPNAEIVLRGDDIDNIEIYSLEEIEKKDD